MFVQRTPRLQEESLDPLDPACGTPSSSDKEILARGWTPGSVRRAGPGAGPQGQHRFRGPGALARQTEPSFRLGAIPGGV